MSFPESQASTTYASSQSASRLQSRFTDDDDRVMGELLQEERSCVSLCLCFVSVPDPCSRGADLNFKQQTYIMVANALNRHITLGGPKNSRAVQDRWLRLKKQVFSFRDILKASGFGWDAQEKRVEAEPPIWDSYLQVSDHQRKGLEGTGVLAGVLASAGVKPWLSPLFHAPGYDWRSPVHCIRSCWLVVA